MGTETKRNSITRTIESAPVRKSNGRRITADDVEQVAKLVAARLNEREATELLGIGHQQWRSWKSRHQHSEEFETLLARVTAAKLDAHLRNIASFEPLDWRASAHLLKIADQTRFGDRPATDFNVNVLPAFNLESFMKAAAKVYGTTKPALETTAQPLQITDASEGSPRNQNAL
jgi:hypothetical protein